MRDPKSPRGMRRKLSLGIVFRSQFSFGCCTGAAKSVNLNCCGGVLKGAPRCCTAKPSIDISHRSRPDRAALNDAFVQMAMAAGYFLWTLKELFRRYSALEAAMLIGRHFAFVIASAYINIVASPDAAQIPRFKKLKLVSFTFTLCVCLVLATYAYAETLVVLLEGLGGRISSRGIVSHQEELSVIPNTIVALPLAQHNWRDGVKLIKQQKPETAPPRSLSRAVQTMSVSRPM